MLPMNHVTNALGALIVYLVQCFTPCVAAGFDDVARSEMLRAKPGQILRLIPLRGGAPDGARAFRVLYRSVGHNKEPIAVTGAIIIPARRAPKGGRNIVAWAHPTSGVVDRCAPSLQPDVSGLIPGLEGLLAHGYIVAATDYEGLGTAGGHPYLIGASEARSILDIVRAARQLPDADATGRFAVWGHSQGGHAALFAAEFAGRYAPELTLVGIAVAAPATELRALFNADRYTSSGKSLIAMALYSWSKIYNLPLRGIVKPQARASMERLAQDCLESLSDFAKESVDEKALAHGLLERDPLTIRPWASIVERNTPRAGRISVPVFVAQGTNDHVVRPGITDAFIKQLCARNIAVKIDWIAGGTHLFAARSSASTAVRWIANRFARVPAPNDCASLKAARR
jgi:alpha-beta hydrolase superfamily lysophospholipase